jgi:hypothetical protein
VDSKKEIESFMEIKNYEIKSQREKLKRLVKDPEVEEELYQLYNEALAYLLSQLKLRKD